MTGAEKLVAELGLVIERERSPLQKGSRLARRPLLAAVYPARKRIVLFEQNITDHCAAAGENRAAVVERLLQHEIYHFLCWQRKEQAGERWDPADPTEEAEAERFAALELT